MIQRSKPPRAGRTGRAAASGQNVRLKPANPFDLIRLIALSQSDARKALAELVQNSFDAGATRVTVSRQKRRGEAAISILDDGRGAFPDLERPEALKHIATNIGHSFKRNLSVSERQTQMMLGKYGIGLLGFWSIGREFEMRSRVGGSEVWCLRLVRDEPVGEVRRVQQSRLAGAGETWTEVIIRGVEPAAARQLSGRKIGEYLGAELRGQLLARDVRLRILDRIARGRAPKDFLVVPQRFLGGRIDAIGDLAVPGFDAARVELYLVDAQEEHRGAVALTCGGAVVCDDIGVVDGHDLEPSIWSSGRLEGIVEFGALDVAPSTRRGFVPGPAADALFAALRSIEPILAEAIDRERERRDAEDDVSLTRQIRKIFRPIARVLPQYDFFDIVGDEGGSQRERPLEGERLGRAESALETDGGADGEPETEVVESGDEPEPAAELLPPGPLAAVRVSPKRSRLLPAARRGLTARAVDAAGRTIDPDGAPLGESDAGGPVSFSWRIGSGAGELAADGARAEFTAAEEPGEVRIVVAATQGDRACEGEAAIEVVDRLGGDDSDAGIPDPVRVFEPEGDWRSRVRGRVWEYNAAHPDYRSVVDDGKRRLRYLVHLFAKEIVLRNYGEPRDERLLERMIEVLTHIRQRG